MTQTSREILDNYQVRKTKKQKAAFRAYATDVCSRYGYSVTEEKGAFGVRNLVVGDVERAKVVYTAHYDTCVRLPFPNFITPKRFDLYLLYQLVLMVGLCVPLFVLGFVGGALIALLSEWLNSAWMVDFGLDFLPLLGCFLLLYLLFDGPANKHTANDNTSGVTVLFDIMAALPADKRAQVAFVFFDLEEAGMLGSSAFAAKHKKGMKAKPLINFDCVSDGENVIFALRKKARHLQPVLERAFVSTEDVAVSVYLKGIFYPSDQSNFRQGVGVAALKASKSGILYMNRIHTKKDTVYREENIAFLTAGAVKLVDLL